MQEKTFLSFSSMSPLFDRLNSPYLVARFQEFCGVRRIDAGDESSSGSSKCNTQQQHGKYSRSHNSKIESDDNTRQLFSGRLIEEYDNPSEKLLPSTAQHENTANGYYNLRSRNKKNNDMHINECSSVLSKLPGPKKEHSRSSSDSSTSSVDSVSLVDNKYEIRYKFLHYLFVIGAGLGNEMFYCVFFPYWFWNVDGYVCRRLVMTWASIMYIGQATKDIVRLPRPASPPVIRMERRYELEYGMPSTHAMIGFGFPFALLYFTIERYQYNGGIGIALGVIWCVCVCLSRLYLGMHSVADVIAGLLFCSFLLPIIIPSLDWIDEYQLTADYAPLVMIAVTLTLALCYPRLDEWSTCRGDTTLILGVQCGVALASWLNYQNNFIPHDRELVGPPPYSIMSPDMAWWGQAILRMLIGYSSLLVVRAVVKAITYHTSCFIFRLDRTLKEHNKKLLVVELPQKYLTYAAISLSVVYISPVIFRYFGIERPTAWTEV